VRVDGSQQRDKDAGGDGDDDEEGAAMAMMEAMTLLELGRGLAAGEWAGVEQAIGGVEHPDGDEHCGG
jgi:hypothetical protein